MITFLPFTKWNSSRSNLRCTLIIEIGKQSNWKQKGIVVQALNVNKVGEIQTAPQVLFPISDGQSICKMCVGRFVCFHSSPFTYRNSEGGRGRVANHPWIPMRCSVWCGYEFVTRLPKELTRHIMSDPYRHGKIHTILSERPKRRVIQIHSNLSLSIASSEIL